MRRTDPRVRAMLLITRTRFSAAVAGKASDSRALSTSRPAMAARAARLKIRAPVGVSKASSASGVVAVVAAGTPINPTSRPAIMKAAITATMPRRAAVSRLTATKRVSRPRHCRPNGPLRVAGPAPASARLMR